MSFNIFKRKEDPIYLDCYTYSHYAYNHAKINYAKNYIPDWWKKEPSKTKDGAATIKHCSAFSRFYAKGIVIPLWGEVEITINPLNSDKNGYDWKSSNEDFDLSNSSHPKNQWDGFGGDNLFNIKFVLSEMFIGISSIILSLILFLWISSISQSEIKLLKIISRPIILPIIWILTIFYNLFFISHKNYQDEKKSFVPRMGPTNDNTISICCLWRR